MEKIRFFSFAAVLFASIVSYGKSIQTDSVCFTANSLREAEKTCHRTQNALLALSGRFTRNPTNKVFFEGQCVVDTENFCQNQLLPGQSAFRLDAVVTIPDQFYQGGRTYRQKSSRLYHTVGNNNALNSCRLAQSKIDAMSNQDVGISAYCIDHSFWADCGYDCAVFHGVQVLRVDITPILGN